jgi:Do/DeqQ family serine protease
MNIENQITRRVGRPGLRLGAIATAALLLVGGARYGLGAHAMSRAAQPAPLPASALLAESAATAAAAVPLANRDSYADIVQAVVPAVVTIRVEGQARMTSTALPDGDPFGQFFGRRSPFGDRQQPRAFRQRGLGSGVIVSPDGYILTNHHVAGSADDIRVELNDGRTFKAKLVGSDAPSDLALLKIEATNLHTLSLGNSDAVRVGDIVLAIGNPLGIGQTVTTGIVSAKGRSTGVGDGSYEDFLQTDAPINQGNSGGALVNLKGELIGINSQILSPSGGNIGIGFAIPANMAGHVMSTLKTGGRVERGQLGISAQSMSSDLAAGLGLSDVTGALVGSVKPGSAAERAGVKQGDVILSVNGQPVNDANALRNRVADATPGSKVTLVVNRDGRRQELTATLDHAESTAAGRDDTDTGSNNRASLGISVQPVTPAVAEELGLPRQTEGLVVQEVDPNGRAASAGIQAGDVIQQVNRRPVRTVDALRAEVQRTTERPLLLLINRGGREIFVTAGKLS